MAAAASTAYIIARAEGKDVAILCDRWEIADAINQRLHYQFTDFDAPSVAVALDQHVCVGDIIMSRHNDATVAVHPGAQPRGDDRIDQVRNGNRWRVAAVDTQRGRIAAERLTDRARVLFDGEYVREHLTLGYAATLHSAQGVTIGTAHRDGVCWTVVSDRASRAMAYVGMTRARDENHLAIYPAVSNEANQHRHEPDEGIHQTCRGGARAAAHALHAIAAANYDRPRTMHTVAARTDRDSLPEPVATLLDRYDQCCAARAHAWRRHTAQQLDRETAYQRVINIQQDAACERSRGVDLGYGLEL